MKSLRFALVIALAGLSVCPGLNASSSQTRLVNELILNEDHPRLLNVYLCANRETNFKFLQYISVPTVFHSFAHPVNLSRLDELHQTWFVISMNCNGSLEFLRHTPPKYFAWPFKWILLNASMEDRDALIELNIMMDSNLIVVSNAASNHTLSIGQVYKREHIPDQLVVERFGEWSSSGGLHDVRDTRVLANRRRNLMGMQFRSSSVIIHNDSLNHLTDFK